ncbi:DUF4198 domain-containing protein [Yersinia nurmii]|uniref:DUF4198 domain-containing protein n=1 Tax=Yersinia nurmii TaxID=685706 RepID=A0AAW7K8D1_9GAMM|nr:DUF4198 domain-containing protein [Yersinia nurmii]MDN0087436.1 DUF4198 domain-containing protein [Yersinia nurmii]
MNRTQTLCFSLGLCASLVHSTVSAHDLWTNMPPVQNTTTATVEMAYGHGFPHGEVIPAKRLHFFAPLKLTNGSEEYSFNIDGKSVKFQQENLKPGSYIALSTYKPTIWSVKRVGEKDEWRQEEDKTQWPGSFCTDNTMSGKTISFVNNPDANKFITQPMGLRLEFVPLQNPNELSIGDDLELQLLYNGKPLANHTFGVIFNNGEARSDAEGQGHEHHHHDHAHEKNNTLSHPALAHTYAFEDVDLKGKTDSHGKLTLPLTAKGQWLISTVAETPHENKNRCDIHLDKATLSYYVIN